MAASRLLKKGKYGEYGKYGKYGMIKMKYGSINVKKGSIKNYLLVYPVRNRKNGQVHPTLVLVLDQILPSYQYLKGK